MKKENRNENIKKTRMKTSINKSKALKTTTADKRTLTNITLQTVHLKFNIIEKFELKFHVTLFNNYLKTESWITF